MPDLVTRDGEVVRVEDPRKARELVASGEFGLRADQEANLVDQDGEVVLFNPEDAATLLTDPDSGYRLATDQEVQADVERAEYSDVGSQIAAGAEGAASGATLGLSDVAIQSGVFGDEFAEESAKRAEHSPTARGVGEVAGVIGSSFLTGGGSAAARGAGLASRAARALSTPARAALGAGRAAERAVGRAVTKEGAGLFGRMAAKGAQVATSGAIEGAAFGAGQELSRAAIDQELFEDPGLAAEQIIAGAGMGAVIGGATGLGMGAAGEAIASGGRAVGRVFKDVKDKAGGYLSMLKKTEHPATLRALNTDNPADDAVLQEMRSTQQRPSWLDDTVTPDDVDDVRQATVRELAEKQDEIAKAADANREAFSVAQKPKMLRRMLKDTTREDVQRIRDVATRKLHDLDDKIQDLVSRADDFEPGGRTAIKELGRNQENLAARFDDAIMRNEPVDAAAESFRVLDDVKRRMGRAQVRASRGANGSQSAASEIENLRENLRSFLEDAQVWGDDIADFQKTLNAAWAPLITIDSAFEHSFGTGRRTLTGIKSTDDLTKTVSEADPKKIGSMVSGLTRAENQKLEQLYQMKLAREVNYQRTANSLFNPSGTNEAIQSNVQAVEDAARKSLAALDGAARATQEAADFASSQARLGAAAEVSGAITGLAAGGWAGGVVGGVAGKFASATRSGMTLSKAIAKGQKAVGKAASSIVERAKGAAKAKAPRHAAQEAVTFLGVKLAADSRAEEYKEMAEVIRSINERQGGFARTSQPIRGDVSQAIDATIKRAGAYLGTKVQTLPDEKADTVFSRARKPKVDPQKVKELRDAVERVTDPVRMLERAAEGTLTVEDVEALKTVYPAVYEDLRTSVLDRMHEVEEMPPYEERLRLGILLDIPSDPSLDPEYMATVQGNAGKLGLPGDPTEPVTTPGNFKSPELAEKYQTRTDDVIHVG